MFPQEPQQQFRTSGADVKIFYQNSTWTKPPGVSQIYMMLIGGGGLGTSGNGASGAVTVWWGSANNVPNNLVLSVSIGNASNTVVQYRNTNGLNNLLTANGASGGSVGTAMTSNSFCASGFFKSVAGQNGAASNQTASATTFLSGGSGSGTTTANYGYTATLHGQFYLQPIIVGVGGVGTSSRGGIGCGGGSFGGSGGRGLILIASM